MNNIQRFKKMLESVDYRAVSKAIVITIAKKMAEAELMEDDLNMLNKAVEEITPKYCELAIPVMVNAYKSAFSDEEIGQLLSYYGEGTPIYNFLTNAEALAEWIGKIDVSALTADPFALVTLLPEEAKKCVKEYIFSDLRARESVVMKGATVKLVKELEGSDLERRVSEIFA